MHLILERFTQSGRVRFNYYCVDQKQLRLIDFSETSYFVAKRALGGRTDMAEIFPTWEYVGKIENGSVSGRPLAEIPNLYN